MEVPRGPASDTQSLQGSAAGESTPEEAVPLDPSQNVTKGATDLHGKGLLQANQGGDMAGLSRQNTDETAASGQVKPVSSGGPDEQACNRDDMFAGLNFG